MPKLSPTAVPSYRLHKQSGQAVVTLNGRDRLLGPHGTKASRDQYDRLVAEWIAGGRQLAAPKEPLAVTEVVAAFWKHVETYYRRPDGTPTSERKNYRDALRPLRRLYGPSPAADFGPLAMKAVRAEMVRTGWCRTHVNKQVRRVRAVFKWAVENEMVPPAVFQGLAAVAGLKAGRSDAREREPVKPVPEPVVEAVLPFASRQVAAMARLQLVTGMRPGEVCAMRGADLDATGRLWKYRPAVHKTAHHGHERVVYLGPQAQAVLAPFLKADPGAYLFSPADAEAERREALAASRKTPAACGNRPGSNQKTQPKKKPGGRYPVESYAHAIRNACRRADAAAHARNPAVPADQILVPFWHPHQLRHTAATKLRQDYGLEAAQVILGHRTLTVTQVYAEKNVAAAERVMAEVG